MISGSALRWARRKRNLSKQEAADLVGVTRNTFLSWENEKNAISEENESRVRAAFGEDLNAEPVDLRRWDAFIAYNAF